MDESTSLLTRLSEMAREFESLTFRNGMEKSNGTCTNGRTTRLTGTVLLFTCREVEGNSQVGVEAAKWHQNDRYNRFGRWMGNSKARRTNNGTCKSAGWTKTVMRPLCTIARTRWSCTVRDPKPLTQTAVKNQYLELII